MSTIDYYNQHAAEFVEGTVKVDFTEQQQKFLQWLPQSEEQRLILDLGCGSGRDSKYFLGQGLTVEAVDGSPELCKLVTEYLGQPVQCMLFQELAAVERYDGIWACASLLHLPMEELVPVLKKCAEALKSGGLLYVSFKQGNFSGERNGRWFTDMTEQKLQQLLAAEVPELKPVECSVTKDVRPGREHELWVNAFARKVEGS